MYQEYDAMTAASRDVICDSFSGDEFERWWKIVIDQYGLVENAWLTRLYENRFMWVPIYNKDTFCAVLMSNGRNESMPSFFDGYIGKNTRLCEFVDKYWYVMEKQVETEKEADANCAKLRELATEFSAEQVFQKLYPDAKFMEVQDECKRVLYCNGRGEQQLSGSLVMHKIEDRVTYKGSGDCRKSTTQHRKLYEVTFDTKMNYVWCECKMFENAGILCRHSIRVWDLHYVLEVPRKYILDRQRKDHPRKHNRVIIAYHNQSKTEEAKNFDRMMVGFEPVAVNAMGNKEAEAAVMDCIEMFWACNILILLPNVQWGTYPLTLIYPYRCPAYSCQTQGDCLGVPVRENVTPRLPQCSKQAVQSPLIYIMENVAVLLCKDHIKKSLSTGRMSMSRYMKVEFQPRQ